MEGNQSHPQGHISLSDSLSRNRFNAQMARHYTFKEKEGEEEGEEVYIWRKELFLAPLKCLFSLSPYSVPNALLTLLGVS